MQQISRYRSHRRTLMSIVGMFLFLGAWELTSSVFIRNTLFLAGPILTLLALVDLVSTGFLTTHFYTSMTEFFIGYVLALVLGIPIGMVLGYSRRIEQLSSSVLMAFYTTPKSTLLPLMIIWLGIGIEQKIFYIFLASMFPVVLNTLAGIEGVDRSLIVMARVFGLKAGRLWFKVILPGAFPFIVTGFRLAAGAGLIALVVSELYAARAGLGYLIHFYGGVFRTDYMLAVVSIVATVGVLSTQVLRILEIRLQTSRGLRAPE